MIDQRDIDDAIDVAIERTLRAQHTIGEELDEGRVPNRPLVDEVVRRAEDLDELAHQARRPTGPLVGARGR